MGPYVVTRDKAGHWVAAELHDEEDGRGTVSCLRTLHRLRIPDSATRSEAVEEAWLLSIENQVHPTKFRNRWSAEDERLAADRSLKAREVAAVIGKSVQAVREKRHRMAHVHYAQAYGYGGD